MKITVLPCIGTNQAVCEIEDGKLPIEIRTPRPHQEGEIRLLLWRLYCDVCRYNWELDRFVKHLVWIMPFWALWSGGAAYLRLHDLWSLSPFYIVLYGFTTPWLIMDGVWLAIQVITKWPQWWRARRAFRALGESWTTIEVLDAELSQIKPEGKEHHWVQKMIDAPNQALGYKYRHLYARLLKRWPPRAMDLYPYGGGFWRHIRRMIFGVPVRQPWYCYPVEK